MNKITVVKWFPPTSLKYEKYTVADFFDDFGIPTEISIFNNCVDAGCVFVTGFCFENQVRYIYHTSLDKLQDEYYDKLSKISKYNDKVRGLDWRKHEYL